MTIAEKITRARNDIEDVFWSGRDEGYAKAGNEIESLNAELEEILYGKDTGSKGFYDKFWDAFQKNGNRTEYHYAFDGWNEESFLPKYDIRPLNAPYGFKGVTGISNLEQWLSDLGVVLDFSQCVSATDLFVGAQFEIIGVIDASNFSNLNYLFTHCQKLKTIRKLVMPTNKMNYNSTFNSCYALENITIEGEIKGNGFNVQWSTKLSKASITSIINALSATTSGLTVTLSKTAVDNAFTADEWKALIAAKSNWTIALV